MGETLLVKFECKFDRLVFASSNFRIYSVKPTKKDSSLKFNKYGSITIVGDLPDLEKDTVYTVEGEYKFTQKFGSQYQIKKLYRDKPTDADSARKFLYEIITVRQADALINVYPNIVEMIINNEEVDLELVKGVKEATFTKIKKKVIKNFCLMDLVNEYSDYGLSLSMIKKLYEEFGSVEMVRFKLDEEPYRCLCSLNGIGFTKADTIVLQIKPEMRTSRQRLEASVEFNLMMNEFNEGSTRISKMTLQNKVYDLTPEPMEFFERIINESKDIEFIKESQDVSRKVVYETELYIARKLVKLNKFKKRFPIDYTKYCTVDGIDLTDEQQQALRNICEHNVSILAGYAGSGKTQTTRAVIEMLDDNGLTYALFAPTGRASQVLSEYTNRPASTIHRGLGYSPMGWTYNEEEPLNVDVLIVDECSMIDIFLMRHLLEAVDLTKTKIMFVLDPKQLPSVGAGNVGYDMICSATIPTVTLTKIFRYGEGGLMQIATKIRNGENYLNEVSTSFRGVLNFGINKDYSMVSCDQEESIKMMTHVYLKLLEGSSIDEIIVLTALNKGDYGTVSINKTIQAIVNPETDTNKGVTHGQTTFRVGDRVMQTKNNYHAVDEDFDEIAVFNGDIGTVKAVEGKNIIVEYKDKTVYYYNEDLEQLSLGYCITIHKSQGSAFKHVILMTPASHKFFLSRNLLYVGVTRAKERVYHITTPDVIASAVRKEEIFRRNTFLCELIVNFQLGTIIEEDGTETIKESIKEEVEKSDSVSNFDFSFEGIFGNKF